MCKPFFSIIIPAYNCEQFVSKSIQSVLNQSFDDFELIIIDDGSTDNTFQIIKEQTLNNKKCIIISQKNQGVSSARNSGIIQSKGEYILYLDADDELSPNSLETIYQAIEKDSSDIIIYNIDEIDSSSKTKRLITNAFSNTHVLYDNLSSIKKDIYPRALGSQFFSSINYTAKSSLVKKNHIDDSMIIFEDTCFFLDILKSASRITYLPNYLYHYRKNTSSCTHTFNFRKLEDLKKHAAKKNDFVQLMNVDIPSDEISYLVSSNLYYMYLSLIMSPHERKKFFHLLKNDPFFQTAIHQSKDRLSKKEYLCLCNSHPVSDFIYLFDYTKQTIKSLFQ